MYFRGTLPKYIAHIFVTWTNIFNIFCVFAGYIFFKFIYIYCFKVAVNSIIESTHYLINQVMLSTKNDLQNALQMCNTDHRNSITDIFNHRPDIFNGIETEALQVAYFKTRFNFVEHRSVLFGNKLVRKKKGNKLKISEKEECFIYIPLLDSLKQLLSNKRIRSVILKEPSLCETGIYYDICDGSLYRNDRYFKIHKDALALILYHDELEVCNPLGSNAMQVFIRLTCSTTH